jgi:RNA polymerase-binding transcription factor DksA
MPLTREQALELCCVIEDRRAALLHELRKDLGQARSDSIEEIAGAVPDAGELRQLDQARQRFDEGSYGSCTDCGNEIDYRRLRVNPAAVRCIQCQTRYEKTYGGAARPTL